MRERDFIEWIRSQGAFDPSAVPVGPGDDAAVVTCGGEPVVVTTDQLLDGVHFVLAEHGPAAAGRKAMARSLSDIAAMAAAPLAAVATVALPTGFEQADAEALYCGLRAAGDALGCPVVGGDVAAWDGALAISVTAFGRPGGIEPVLRSGAEPGDAICVTGALGGAWRSGRDLSFTPRVVEARAMAAGSDLHAMIDLSDGLATDLGHLCVASGVGAEIRADAVPIHPDAALAGPERSPLAAALTDGEDYELLLALPADRADSLIAAPPFETPPITRIGTIVAGDTIVLVGADGSRRPIDEAGWEHHT